MLEMETDGGRMAQEGIKKWTTSPLGVFCHAAGTGILGIVILTAFFSMLLPAATLGKILPVFIAFNAAASAYGIVDKAGPDFPGLTVSLVLISLLFAGTETVLSGVLLPWQATAGLHFIIGTVTALLFSSLGAGLAKKCRKINHSSQA